MEKVILCSNILYNKDISDKMNEITSLKQSRCKYETQKVEYSSMDEWYTTLKEACLILKKGLDKWIVEDNFEYRHMAYQGMTSRQHFGIPPYIEQALNLMTKENNKEWAYNVSWDIYRGIEGFIHGFIRSGVWGVIYSQLDPRTMSKMIYNNITWQLDEEGGGNSILESVPIFTCQSCGKKDDWVTEENICFDCEERP